MAELFLSRGGTSSAGNLQLLCCGEFASHRGALRPKAVEIQFLRIIWSNSPQRDLCCKFTATGFSSQIHRREHYPLALTAGGMIGFIW
jgi:hypothetical protein